MTNEDVMSSLTAAAIVVAVLGLTVVIGGTAIADDLSEDNVTVEADEPLLEADNQTVNVTVENPSDEEVLVQPIIEIPLQDGLNVTDANREAPIPGEDEPRVTIASPGTAEGLINDSTFRAGTDSLQIEGADITPGDEDETFEIDVLEVDATPEVDVDLRVFPLNDPTNDVRLEETFDVVGQGTIEAEFPDSDRQVTVKDNQGNIEAPAAPDIQVGVAPDLNYEVVGDHSVFDETDDRDNLSLEVEPGEFDTEVVEFTDAERGDAQNPAIAAQTGSIAEIFGEESRELVGGDFETNTSQNITFDMEVSSGLTGVLVEDVDAAPLQGVDSTGDFEDATWSQFTDDNENGIATLEFEGAVNDDVEIALEGYPLGDVTLDNEVTSNDAQIIAEAITEDTTEDLVGSEYGDVTDTGELNAADAMKIAQYDEDNRDANEVSGR